MKRVRILLILNALLAFSLTAIGFAVEINWTKHTIDGNFIGATLATGIDLDQDGDIDVIGAALYGHELAWWDNDGDQNFIKTTIEDNFDHARPTQCIDLDKDGHIDVVGAGIYLVAWWKNNGDETFTKFIIDDSFDSTTAIHVIDIDGDNDLDVLGASQRDEIVYWENDGNQNFNNKYIIADDFVNAWSVYGVDLDDDGDTDVIGAAAHGNEVAWWENVGAPNFIKHAIDNALYSAVGAVAADLNQDGDIDVVAASSPDGNDGLYWYENDGNQNFSQHEISGYPRNASALRDGSIADLDGDGDLDILTPEFYSSGIFWWENDGNQNFTAHTVTTPFSGATSVYAVDMDDDGDLDILGTSEGWNEVAWFENDPIPYSSDIGIGMVPDTWPVAVTAGESFRYTGRLTNYLEFSGNTDVWIKVNLEGTFIPIRHWDNVYMNVGENLYYPVTQWVPGSATPGDYNYIAYCGDYSTQIFIDSCYYPMTVVSRMGSMGGATSWNAYGWQDEHVGHELISDGNIGHFPNPFNAATNITYDIPQTGNVSLKIYNLAGQWVETLVDGYVEAGEHSVTWDASSYSSGVYFYKLTSGDKTFTKRMMLLKQ